MKDKKMGPPPEPSEAGSVGRGGRNEAGAVPAATRQERSRAEFLPTICRYCGGVIKLIPAKMVYGESTRRLGMEGEYVYQCQNCNARVGCHKGTTRPLGNVANEVLRLKRMEAHRVFDALWKSGHMTRTGAYRWLAGELHLRPDRAHIGGFEMDQCQKVIELCGKMENEEAA